jgi:hypothetical protein
VVNSFSIGVSRPFNKERIVFSINGAGKKWIFPCKRMNLNLYFIPNTKNN